MGRAYSQDLRERVLGAYDRGLRTKQIAKVFNVSCSWARRVKQRRNQFGETRRRAMGGVTVVKIDMARLAQLVAEQPDATLKELGARLGVRCSESAICMALKRAKLTLKKNDPCSRAGSAGRRPASR